MTDREALEEIAKIIKEPVNPPTGPDAVANAVSGLHYFANRLSAIEVIVDKWRSGNEQAR